MCRRWLLSLLLILWVLPAHAQTASHFDGTDSVITVTQQAAINGNVFTVGCWTRYASLGESSGGRMLAKDTGWNIRLVSGDTYRLIADGWTTTDGQWDIPTQGTNTWAQIVVSYDGTSDANDPVMYRNGVSIVVTQIAGPVGTFIPGTGDLYIGNTNGSARTWDGELAECFFYNRVLSANEVVQVKTKGPASLQRGLIGYWPLGVFGARNYTSTLGLTGTPTSVTLVSGNPPLSYGSQSEEYAP